MAELWRRADSVFQAPVEDALMLMNVESGRFHELNDVAARIWELLADPMDVDTLVDRLMAEFDVSRDECAAAVSAFLGELRSRGLLTAG